MAAYPYVLLAMAPACGVGYGALLSHVPEPWSDSPIVIPQ